MISSTRPYNDYEIVAANLLDDDPPCVSDLTTYALCIDSLLGRGGMTGSHGSKTLIGKRQ
ncbi:hypothetical protein ABFA25_11625 [Mycobacterium lepromatosis]